MKTHPRGRTEPAHYCGQCEIEVFGVLFIREQEKKHFVHCLDCARRHSNDLKGFVCLIEYQLKELKEVYTNFKLTSQNPIPNMANAGAAQRYQQAAHNTQATLTKSPVAAVANHPMMAGSSLASTMINSMASMTPQQQLALQQVLKNSSVLLKLLPLGCPLTSKLYQFTDISIHTVIHVFVSGTSSAASNGKSLLILVSVLEPVRGSGAETTVEKFKVSFILFYPVLVLDPPLESPLSSKICYVVTSVEVCIYHIYLCLQYTLNFACQIEE